jgi:hypothetical protein
MKRLFFVSFAVATLFPSSLLADDLTFHAVTPCVVFDTRTNFGGPGPFAAEQTRQFHIVGSTANFAAQGGTPGGCGVPGFAGPGQPVVQAIFINYIAIDGQGAGQLKAWATDQSEPAQGAIVNYQLLSPPMNNSNGVVTEVRQDSEGNDISVRARSAAVNARGVILGYFTRGHKHGGEDITSGFIAEPRIDLTIARYSQVLQILLGSDGTGSGLDADKLDGNDLSLLVHDHDALYARKYARTIFVPATADASVNGAAFAAAVLATAGASAANPFLIKLDAGVYELSDILHTNSFVDVEGAGQNGTVIRHASFFFAAGNAEFRFLTIESTSGVAALNSAGTLTGRLILNQVTLKAGAIGLSLSWGIVELNDVTILMDRADPGSLIGVLANATSPETGEVFLNRCSIRVTGGSSGSGMDIDHNFSATLIDTSIDVQGSGNATGIDAATSSPGSPIRLTMAGGRISVSGPNAAQGVVMFVAHAATSGFLDLRNLPMTITSTTSQARGLNVLLTSGSLSGTLRNAQIDANTTDGSGSIGVDFAAGAANLTIEGSAITSDGTGLLIRSGVTGTARVGNTLLEGAIANTDDQSASMNPVCVLSYDTALTPLSAVCN